MVRGGARRCARVIGQSNTRHATQRFRCAGLNTIMPRPQTHTSLPTTPAPRSSRSPRHALRGQSCVYSRFARSADVAYALAYVPLMPAPPSRLDLAPKLSDLSPRSPYSVLYSCNQRSPPGEYSTGSSHNSLAEQSATVAARRRRLFGQ